MFTALNKILLLPGYSTVTDIQYSVLFLINQAASQNSAACMSIKSVFQTTQGFSPEQFQECAIQMGTPSLDITSWSGAVPLAEDCLGSMDSMQAPWWSVVLQEPSRWSGHLWVTHSTSAITTPNSGWRGIGLWMHCYYSEPGAEHLAFMASGHAATAPNVGISDRLFK